MLPYGILSKKESKIICVFVCLCVCVCLYLIFAKNKVKNKINQKLLTDCLQNMAGRGCECKERNEVSLTTLVSNSFDSLSMLAFYMSKKIIQVRKKL